MARYNVEVTDTFGGEANYSWVRRYTLEGSTDTSTKADRKLVRDAKAIAGWTGMRCRTDSYGDSVTVTPIGRNAPCWVMFINYDDSPVEEENSESESV